MDYIESMRVFRTVVELKSFSRAAEHHGMAPPAVSRTIAALEQKMGCRLLNRTTRRVSLTEAAERFYESCVRIIDEVDTVEAEVATQTREPSGVLRLVAHTTATIHRLVPLIADFKLAHPKVALDVTLTERPVDLVGEGYDLGIVVPFMLISETTVVRLLERIPFVIVASPDYLKRTSTPRHPSDLNDHLFVPLSPSIRRPDLRFVADGHDVNITLRFDVSSNSPAFNREMVLRGFGIGIAPLALINRELASGTLQQLLADFPLVDEGIELQLAYSNRTLLPAKVRAFIDHAVAFFGASAQAGTA
ncbi:LysR family transcriptional regulator [Burkholderia lata]|uniref:LysR family transcriptional regulator n=1 Tax=Burkholderia lata (strain ATCC 17760 / DSM 23089 / LMG 22485 / NCIMB 9086 / R18194 / 383) TaxID=482957 RepID=A0A6P2UE28_BURL3|nr:LysR family transcriptional regulator [Burkholderia lata]VWC73235.1 LysR family transcriptional regulator [Burkholderia lata]